MRSTSDYSAIRILGSSHFAHRKSQLLNRKSPALGAGVDPRVSGIRQLRGGRPQSHLTRRRLPGEFIEITEEFEERR